MADVEYYKKALRGLMPKGSIWTIGEKKIGKLIDGFAPELARVDVRTMEMIQEADTDTCVDTISDWEKMTGIPNRAIGEVVPSDLEDRRELVWSRLAAIGGSSIEYITGQVEALGFEITIKEFRKTRCGSARCGDVMYNVPWAHTLWIEVNASNTVDQNRVRYLLNRIVHGQITIILVFV